MTLNVSKFSDQETATTNYFSASQRARNLASFGCKNVIELCCGPSLKTLEAEYRTFDIQVSGNDIEDRWRAMHPKGRWIIGDAQTIDLSKFDAAIFAPPLSVACSGRREDALPIDKVFPRYIDFINKKTEGIMVLVLPGKTLSIKSERDSMHKLLSKTDKQFEIIALKCPKNKITKYVDVYIGV